MLGKIRNEKGFTLIELMVVIVIIGILAAVAIPRFMGAQDRARVSAVNKEIDAVRKALSYYETDYSTFLPTASGATYAAMVTNLVDGTGTAYVTLPPDPPVNFNFVSYAGDATTYTLIVTANDNRTSTLTLTPDGVTKQ